MSEIVQLRRDTAANIAGYFGQQGELFYAIDQQRLVPQDGATLGGFPVAKLAELQAEATTRAAAVSAETQRAEAAEVANAANIATNTQNIAVEVARAEAAEAALSNTIAGAATVANLAAEETARAQGDTTTANNAAAALAAEVARAEAAEGLLSAAVGNCATTGQLAANTQFANALYPPERPGDGFGFFTNQVTGQFVLPLAGNFLPIPQSTLQQGAEGMAANIIGAGYLISREFYPIEPNRLYLARVAFSVTQPGLGGLITFGVFQYNAAKQLIGSSQVVLASFSALFPASGRQAAQASVTRIVPLPTGDVGVDPSTRYVRLVVQNADPFQYVAVEVMRWVDITDSSVFAPSVATLQAQIGQLASQLAAMTQNFYVASRALIADSAYAAVASDGGVEVTKLTQSRTITLPPLASMSPFVPFPVGDGGGNVNGTIVINVVPAAGDLFNGVSAANGGGITIQAQNGVVAPRAGSTSWLL